MKISSFIRKAVAISLIVFGLFFVLAFFIHTDETGETIDSDYVMLVILGLIPTAVGIFVFSRTNKESSIHLKNKLEKKILSLAADHGGKLTAAQLSMNSELSLDQATRKLNELQEKGYAVLENTESGALIYDFHGLIAQTKQ